MYLSPWTSKNILPTLSGHSAPEILNTSINRVEDTLKAFIANRIPQNKKPGIRPIGVIQEIAGKFKMNITKKNVQQARIFTSMCGSKREGRSWHPRNVQFIPDS